MTTMTCLLETRPRLSRKLPPHCCRRSNCAGHGGTAGTLLRLIAVERHTLGGLAGVPFVGKAGLAAYAHHVPDNGKLLILFAPHVGIGSSGQVRARDVGSSARWLTCREWQVMIWRVHRP